MLTCLKFDKDMINISKKFKKNLKKDCDLFEIYFFNKILLLIFIHHFLLLPLIISGYSKK